MLKKIIDKTKRSATSRAAGTDRNTLTSEIQMKCASQFQLDAPVGDIA